MPSSTNSSDKSAEGQRICRPTAGHERVLAACDETAWGFARALTRPEAARHSWSACSSFGWVELERQVYRLREGSTELRVEAWFNGRNRARLLVNGSEAATADTDEIGRVDLRGDSHHARVTWWWKGRVHQCVLVEEREGVDDDAPARRREVQTPFEPPAGTAAHRRYEWAEAHPRLYAARHAGIKVVGTVGALLGVGAAVRALVGRLIPRIDVPDLDMPEWLRYLDPVSYLRPVLEWLRDLAGRLFGWLPDVDLSSLGWVRYAIGIAVAVGIGVDEVRRRRARAAREQREHGADADSSPEAGPSNDNHEDDR